MLPWPNRIEDGSYEFDGKQMQLPLTEPEHGNAIHGLVRGATWSVVDLAPDRVVMEYVLEPQPGYPFTLASQHRVRALGCRPHGDDDGPEHRHGGVPVRERAAPVSHARDADGRHAAAAGAGVRSSSSPTSAAFPCAPSPVDGTDYDFRAGRTIGGTVLDNAYTELERDADGRARVLLDDPDSDSGLTLWVDESYPWLMVFTGDPLPDVARRSVAVEPMTCPPNAFRTGDSLIRLEPGESTASTWGIEPRLAAEGGLDVQ